jgi:DNA-binding NarL/FixJ family response regulator
METSPIGILVIDDHDMFRAGLRLLLEPEPGLKIIAEARSGNEALEAARNSADVILLDLDLGSDSGVDVLAELTKVAPQARILVLTGVLDPKLHLQAICLGAIGIVLKLEAPEMLVKAIRKVHAGEVWLNRTATAQAMAELQVRIRKQEQKKPDPDAAKIGNLTAREREIVVLIGEGLRNKAIGERLCISEKTVRHYLTSIFNKLELTDRLELMIYAYQHDLAKVPSRETLPVAGTMATIGPRNGPTFLAPPSPAPKKLKI